MSQRIIEVTDVNKLDGFSDVWQRLNYIVKGEFGIPGRRYFRKGGNERAHHVHVFSTGDPHIKRHLAFRDYLIAHPEVMEQYGMLKQKIAEECDNDMNKYMQGKNDFIQHYEKLAVAWCSV